jgi:hypothetical protein
MQTVTTVGLGGQLKTYVQSATCSNQPPQSPRKGFRKKRVKQLSRPRILPFCRKQASTGIVIR